MSIGAAIAAEGNNSEGEYVGMCGVRGDTGMLTGADFAAEGIEEDVGMSTGAPGIAAEGINSEGVCGVRGDTGILTGAQNTGEGIEEDVGMSTGVSAGTGVWVAADSCLDGDATDLDFYDSA